MNFNRLALLALPVLAFTSIPAVAGVVYLDDSQGNLYAGDPTTGAFTLVGNSGITGGFSDIDFTSNGTLYGLDASGNLYTINTSTAAPTLVGSTGIGGNELVGLAGDGSGNLFAGGSGRIAEITPPSATATPIGSGQAYDVAGDLEFVGSALYLTSGGGANPGGELYSVDPATGIGTDIGTTGFGAVWGLAYDSDNGVFYGYTSGGVEFTVNPGNLATDTSLFNTITGTSIGTGGDQLLGAAFISSSPEPATFGLLLMGSAAILLVAVRRRKANRTA